MVYSLKNKCGGLSLYVDSGLKNNRIKIYFASSSDKFSVVIRKSLEVQNLCPNSQRVMSRKVINAPVLGLDHNSNRSNKRLNDRNNEGRMIKDESVS